MTIDKQEYENLLLALVDYTHLDKSVVGDIINYLWGIQVIPTEAAELFDSIRSMSLKDYYIEYGERGEFTNTVAYLFGDDRAKEVKNFNQLTSDEKSEFMNEFTDDFDGVVFDYNANTGDIVFLK